MSEHNERVNLPAGGEEERVEYGRQLAMDSIMQEVLGAEAQPVRSRRRVWLMAAGLATVGVFTATGLGLAQGWFDSDARPKKVAKGTDLSGGTALQHTADSKKVDRFEKTVKNNGKLPPGLKGGVVEPGQPSGTDMPPAEKAISTSLVRTPKPKKVSLRGGNYHGPGDVMPPNPSNAPSTPAGPVTGGGLTSLDSAGGGLFGGRRSGVWNGRIRANQPGLSGESYDRMVENVFRRSSKHPLSTFSIDVDTGAYANIRDLLKHKSLPPRGAVRIEEMVNYFDYEYPQPTGKHPICIHVDMASAPWQPKHRLVRIGLQTKQSHQDRPAANLVFLIDVSGSMGPDNKLPLLKRCMADMVGALRGEDRVAMVVYAGAAGMVLDSTRVDDEEKVLKALQRLKSGGSTNGGAGIQLAYKIARKHFVKDGINRVILASDGDFNVGMTSRGSLIEMIEKQRETGVFLSVLGFGRGNLRDSQMEQIANKGNGTYHYIDSVEEGRRVLVDKIGATLVTVAKDVKIQVEFNPSQVAGYRLIGYENRMLAKQDFNDDTKDAGEVGSGHTVTALYEVIPASVGFRGGRVDDLRYGKKEPKPKVEAKPGQRIDELLFVKVRYKLPDGDTSTKLTLAVKDQPQSFDKASADFRFAASVAGFGMVLRKSPLRRKLTYAGILEIAEGAVGQDRGGYRSSFLKLVSAAQKLDPQRR